jgi:GNAT superfamily N-acetyltransferase
MPWVVRDVVNDINKAVARRWQGLDPLLPEPSDLPEGCTAPLLSIGGNGRPSGLGVCRHQQVPDAATWIAGMTRPGATAYLQTMFVRPGERSGGTGTALARHVHGELDTRGIDLTLLHYSQVNPLSAPFWHRMGYRPLWSTWEARPASTLR